MTPLTACKLAALIYEDWDVCEPEAALLGFDGFKYWDHADTQAMLVQNDPGSAGPGSAGPLRQRPAAPERKRGESVARGFAEARGSADPGSAGGSAEARASAEAVLVFRGTEARKAKWRDLVSNFGYPVLWAGEGRVHSGYLHHFNRIRDEVLGVAEDLTVPLHLVGHSMGGCLATLFAAWAPITPARLWTFGAPKALDLKATAAIHCPISRYVNARDFAPHWPPVPGLIHPARAIEIDSGGWPGPVTRHGTGRYLAALERLRPPRSAYLDP